MTKSIEPGTTCGWLTVLRPGPPFRNARQSKSTSVCRCKCGRETTVLNANFREGMKHGRMMSCGCYAASLENRASRFNGEYYGESTTRLARCHVHMMRRCYDPTCKSWRYYGGQGITVAESWHTYRVFKDWALSHGYRDDLTLDRIDYAGNYEPENCRWITIQDQQRNKRSNKWLTYRSETKPLVVWVDELGLDYYLVRSRLRYGWSVERAFETPSDSRFNRPGIRLITYKGQTKPLTLWVEELELSYARVKARLYLGWSVEDAFEKPFRTRRKHEQKETTST